MTLAELLTALAPVSLDGLAFPRRLLGAFRRKSITFANGLTDETTIVFWFQSKTFTIDLRLPDGAETALLDRQGWVGDTSWDAAAQQLSWTINRSYQPRNQWPEPATLNFIGNSVIEFAPSGAYVEDWRQQSTSGPLLGLRLLSLFDESTGQTHAMDGGLIIASNHAAYAQSRLPAVDAALNDSGDLAKALEDRRVTEQDIASYEVSVASNGDTVTHSTQPERVGQPILAGDFGIEPDGSVALAQTIDGSPCRLRFVVDLNIPDFVFDNSTPSTAEALVWAECEKAHLMRHAWIAR
ncbi:hypothetical protein IP81_11390 [Novosphingobium sp. AAP83]|uniref:hypothetical protein n=1 Tax=Novosphingobium sp. AAP83 TaxID=1523425 RepID=UPI0006B90E30|nr:hypothetical protein [Novosphingobium sp. AAP83]KPF91504.1 hypothetical protein IP81_11390 [Novosphingobium sp. AAP83]